MSRTQEFNLGTFNPGHAMREYHHITMDFVHTNESERHRAEGNAAARKGKRLPESYAKSKLHMGEATKAGRKADKAREKTRKVKPARMERIAKPKVRNLANYS